MTAASIASQDAPNVSKRAGAAGGRGLLAHCVACYALQAVQDQGPMTANRLPACIVCGNAALQLVNVDGSALSAYRVLLSSIGEVKALQAALAYERTVASGFPARRSQVARVFGISRATMLRTLGKVHVEQERERSLLAPQASERDGGSDVSAR